VVVDENTNGAQMNSYVERGGLFWTGKVGSIGGGYVSWPFGTLVVTSERLRFSVKTWRWFASIWALDPAFQAEPVFQVEKSQIHSISKKRGLFSKGLAFQQSNPEYPTRIVFWTFNYPTLSNALRHFGYDVVDT
jgi:hypothetical protein